MRVGFERGLSERELRSRREFLEFVAEEQRKERDAEDRTAYQTYLNDLEAQQQRVPKAYRVQPLSFEEWRELMPGDQPDPTIRGLVATRTALTRQHVKHFRERTASESLTDDDLHELGFDLRQRPNDNSEVNPVLLRQAYETFLVLQPQYDHASHFNQLSDFINRYHLEPTEHNLECSFAILLHLGIIQQKPAEPERDPALNEHGDLTIQLDPEVEREQKRHDYFNKPVVTDPLTHRSYTEAELDRMGANEYRRLMKAANNSF